MAGIYHPSRGGVRGGRDQFNWDDVKTDKDRESYLGHSVMVPTGKWQEGKDLIWYTRNKSDSEKAAAEKQRRKEIQSVKDLESRAMAAALGHQSFSTGTTSLTAKELQEVLSRGQTEHNDGERIEGMGYKKSFRRNKQASYGTQFEGGVDHSKDASEEDSSKRDKKKKKKKDKKKKKERRVQENRFSDDNSHHDLNNRKKRKRDGESNELDISKVNQRYSNSNEHNNRRRHNRRSTSRDNVQYKTKRTRTESSRRYDNHNNNKDYNNRDNQSNHIDRSYRDNHSNSVNESTRHDTRVSKKKRRRHDSSDDE